MALVDTKQKVDIPHEPGEWLVIQKLNWRQLEIARDAATEKSFRNMRSMGADVVRHLQRMVDDPEAERAAQGKKAYDQACVLEAGIADWSYDAKVSKKTIEQLDTITADWAYDAIVALNQPRSEDDRKND